jgi:predicted ATP-grasp superfamily ATP-dependent carboligase
MTDDVLNLSEKPSADYLIAGWRRQWSNGGRISSGLPRYLIEKLGARKIGELGKDVSSLCYPFQVAGTHDTFRPKVAFRDGLPTTPMERENIFYDCGNGLIVFLGEEPWARIDVYGQGFFQAVQELGIKQTVAVEGVNGPAPPEMERRVNCVYSRPEMKEALEAHGLQLSSRGTEGGRRGPTIGMAMVTLAHYEYPDVQMFRLGSMAPMYPFVVSNNEQLGIFRDHRSFYDIMRRLNSLFGMDVDLSELRDLGNTESRELQSNLDRIGASNDEAKQIIEQVKRDYDYLPFIESSNLDPGLDRALEDILQNMPDDLEQEP